MSNWLTPTEVEELTGYKRRSAQKLALGEMHIPFISRALDGFPLVSREILQLTATRTVLRGNQARGNT